MNEEITNYLEYLFSTALKKSGDLDEAQDLTQETLLAAIQYQKRGGEISNMKSWLSSTLNHKWNDMLRRKYKLPLVSIDMVSEELNLFAEESDDDKPTTEQIRREVAFLAKLHRDVIVKHYLQGKKVQDIANKMGLPKGTILSRLSSGREQMRKGFDTMEQYEKQSYIPERLDISFHGKPGLHEEPFSLVSDDMMKQNILIVAYRNPITTVEIAKALGIPTAYIEKAVDDMVKSELMCRVGNKVFTDFMIVTPDDQLKGLDVEIELAETHYQEIWSCMKDLFDDLRKLNWYTLLSPKAKISLEYYAMLDVFSRGIYSATKHIVDVTEEYPYRPDGGAWIAVGNHYPADFDVKNYRFQKYCYGGERRAYFERFLNTKFIDLHVYDTQPDLNKYEHGPVPIHDDNLCKLLYIIHQGIPFDAVGFNVMFAEDIPHLVECGVLQYGTYGPEVAIPVLSKEQYDDVMNVIFSHMYKLADLLETPLRDSFPKLKVDIPKHLEGRVAGFRQYSCYSLPMAIVKSAIKKGDFLQGMDEPAPPMIFVVEE